MNPFLLQLAQNILEKHPDNLQDIAVILPSRRATLYFGQHLASLLKKPVWMPKTLALQDFIYHNSGLEITDELQLIIKLFNIYKQFNPTEEFDNFYSWGSMLVKDFDDIDRNMAPAHLFFKNLHAIKEIEAEGFGTEGYDMKKAKEFWEEMEAGKSGNLSQQFLRIWEVMEKLHLELTSQLLKENMAYEGLAYRKLAEKISSPGFSLPYHHIYFGGLNALSVSEELIVKTLCREGIATSVFDADAYYLDDEKHEAGHYLRKYRGSWKNQNLNNVGSTLLNAEKELTITGAPLLAGQVKALACELEKLLQKNIKVEDIAIVLPDEQMLLPVLNIIPPSVIDVNVTMGFPLSSTSTFELFDAVLQLFTNQSPDNKGFYYKDLLKVYNQPLLRQLYGKSISRQLELIKKSQFIYFPAEPLLKNSEENFSNLLFSTEGKPEKLLDFFMEISVLQQKMQNTGNSLETEFGAVMQTVCQRLRTELQQENINISLKVFRKIFNEYVSGQKIPFSGEPVKGLQIMGMLETRTLDFKHLLVLSMNEGIIPAEGSSNSFIPYDLRKAFMLPTRDEQSALYAYHFFRLLQRAESIQLFYNTEAGNFSAGEKSRFLLQIEHLLVPSNPKINFRQHIYSTGFSVANAQPISVEKSPEIISALKERLTEKGISPTALISYSLCPLRYYFKNVLQLREEEEDKPEIVENWLFGNIYHKSMQYLYNSFTGKEVAPEDLNTLKEKIEEAIRFSCGEENLNYNELVEGRNFFAMETIRILMERTLDLDKEGGPFTIISLEERHHHSLPLPKHGIEVKLHGEIDRLEKVGPYYRVIDYKTGLVETTKLQLMAPVNELEYRHKEAFQLMFYSYLVNRGKGIENIQSTILPLKKIVEGYKSLELVEGTGRGAKKFLMDNEAFEIFENNLKDFFDEVFDPEVPITQTTDEKNCSFCSYRRICGK